MLNVSKTVEWIYFGERNLSKTIHEIAFDKLSKKTNFRYEFKGFIVSAELLDFYKSNQVDLFINLSDSEGIPLSIMEVMSFGVPVLAKDVGGFSEIVVNGINGLIVAKEYSLNFVARELMKVIEQKEFFSKECIVDFQRKEYNGIKNYKAFSSTVLHL